jgi:ABC-2 type transport system permease protein
VRDSLRAEWTKLRTRPSTIWLLLGTATLTVAVSAAAAAATRCPSGGCADDPAKISLTGIYLGQAVIAVLAVMAVSDEYATGMIRVTLAAIPRRLTLLAAKAVAVAGLALVTGAIAVGGSLLAGRLILPGQGIGPADGYPPLSPGDGAVLRAAAGSVLYLVLIALLSLGVATALREAASAVGGVLGLLYLFPIVAAVTGDAAMSRHLEQVGPMTAGLAIEATTNLAALPIGPWAGLGVLAAWAAAALLAGALLLQRRDALSGDGDEDLHVVAGRGELERLGDLVERPGGGDEVGRPDRSRAQQLGRVPEVFR